MRRSGRATRAPPRICSTVSASPSPPPTTTGPVATGSPGLVPAQPRRVGQAEPVHDRAASAGVGETGVSIGHAASLLVSSFGEACEPSNVAQRRSLRAEQATAPVGVEDADAARGSHRWQPDPVRPLQRPVPARLQSGHADGRARRAGGEVRSRRRAARRGGGRRGAQAQPRLQPHPRVRARLPAGSAHAGVRHPTGLRHRSRGGDRGGQQDCPRPDQCRHRGRRGHHLGRTARGQRGPAPGDAGAQPGEVVARPAAGRGEAQSGTGLPAGHPAQRRTAHRTVDGGARRHHGARVGSRPAVPGRVGAGVAPAPRRGVRAGFLR